MLGTELSVSGIVPYQPLDGLIELKVVILVLFIPCALFFHIIIKSLLLTLRKTVKYYVPIL